MSVLNNANHDHIRAAAKTIKKAAAIAIMPKSLMPFATPTTSDVDGAACKISFSTSILMIFVVNTIVVNPFRNHNTVAFSHYQRLDSYMVFLSFHYCISASDKEKSCS